MKSRFVATRPAKLIEDCSGAVYAELALSFILLLPLFAGVVKVSLLLNSSIDLIQASRIITRSAFHADAVDNGSQLCGALTSLADNALSAVGLNAAQYSIDVIPVEYETLDPEASPYTQALQIVVSLPNSASSMFHLPPFPAYIRANGALISQMGVCNRIGITQFQVAEMG